MYIHEARYKRIKLFKDKSNSFISWLCPLLKPSPYQQNEFLYKEGDEVTNVFFLIKGYASFVLQTYQNCKYINIDIGDHFGIIDIVGSCQINGYDYNEWYFRRNSILRQFNIFAVCPVEVLTLVIADFNRMKTEFQDIYEQLLTDAAVCLRRSWLAKLKAIKVCRRTSKILGREELEFIKQPSLKEMSIQSESKFQVEIVQLDKSIWSANSSLFGSSDSEADSNS